MTRLQSWLTFALLSLVVVVLYLLGVFEYVPLVGREFITGPTIARVAILTSLVLFLLILVRVLANLRTLRAEREAIDEASLVVDKPIREGAGDASEEFTRLLAELPGDGLLASRVELLKTYLKKRAKTNEVCLLLARQSGLDNEFGDLVFSAELVLLGLMNLIGLTGVFVLLAEVVTGMFEAVQQMADFRAQAASTLLPLLESIIDVALVFVVLYGVARVLVRIPQRRQRLAIIAADELVLYIMSKSRQWSMLPSVDAKGDVPDARTQFDGLELSAAVTRAFTMAAEGGDRDSPLQTAPLLVALARADSAGHWDRIELAVGELSAMPYHRYLDPAPSSDHFEMSWGNIRLSDTLASALTLCDTMCREYDMSIVHPGVVALALVADPQSGASRCVLRSSDLSHDGLLEKIQDDIIGESLEGVGSLIARHALAVT